MIVDNLNVQPLLYLGIGVSLILWIAKWVFILRFRRTVMRGMRSLSDSNPRPYRRPWIARKLRP